MSWILGMLIVGYALASDTCTGVISAEDAIRYARQYVGEVKSVHLSKNRHGECYYRVRGTEGSAVVDARDGKVLRFHRKR